ncbi:MAG TPA: transcriptional regulator [Streptosporangiaceae bacterium]|jgi:DNA-binding MarR family transcriptional regulator|nr:transcriptional regulator [Streptosporangiaceae bacterium]
MSGSGAEAADRREAHVTTALDETVHQRYRLGILVITSRARQVDFGYLREALGLTSGNLSTHLMVLEEAGLVQVEKGYEGRRPRTWVSITRPGRAALAAEMAALTELVREHSASQPSASEREASEHSTSEPSADEYRPTNDRHSAGGNDERDD